MATDGWRQRFRTPIIYGLKVAQANRERVVLGTDRMDAATPRTAEIPVAQLFTVDMSSGEVRPLTDRPSATRDGWISPDGGSVYYLDDDHGSEIGQLVRIPFGGGAAVTVTDLPPYTLRGVGFSQSGNRIAVNPINSDGFQLWCADLDASGVPGKPWRVFSSEHETMGAHLDHDGRLAAVQSTERAGGLRNYAVAVYDTDRGERVAELAEDAVSTVPVRFSPLPDDPRLLVASDASGFVRPLLWDPRTGKRTELSLGGPTGDTYAVDWSADGRWLLLCRYRQGTGRLLVHDLDGGTTEEITAIGEYHDPLGDLTAFGPGRDVVSIHESGDQPVRIVRLRTGAAVTELISGGGSGGARPIRSITFPSADGTEIQGWLGVPDGAGPFPAVLEAHGGPHWARLDIWDPVAQALLDHGIAFLTVNFRGSTTFGRAFKEQIWGRIGEAELADVAAGREFLVERGIAYPDGVLLFGASYGGFLTLLGLGRQPDLWAGGIALAPVGDTALCYAEASDALKGAMRAWYTGTPAQRPDGYAAASPVNYVHRVRAPLLLIGARHDTRTPPGQLNRYVELLRAYGKEFELIQYDDGHAPPPPAVYERMIDFARDVSAKTEAGAR